VNDYYDRDGNPMPEDWYRKDRYADRFAEWYATSKRVGSTTVGDVRVSTVWLGLDHAYHGLQGVPAPLIFETMIFGGKWDGECDRYSTEEAAMRGHLAAVDALRVGWAPFAFLENEVKP
jgi:hypothetical protein